MRPPPQDEIFWVTFPKLMEWLTDLWKMVELCSGKLEIGTYDGDGATSQEVDTDFPIKYLKILVRPGAEGDTEVFEKLDESWGVYCIAHLFSATHEHYILDNRITALGAEGGFTVDDDGADEHPNKNGVTYSYLAVG